MTFSEKISCYIIVRYFITKIDIIISVPSLSIRDIIPVLRVNVISNIKIN